MGKKKKRPQGNPAKIAAKKREKEERRERPTEAQERARIGKEAVENGPKVPYDPHREEIEKAQMDAWEEAGRPRAGV